MRYAEFSLQPDLVSRRDAMQAELNTLNSEVIATLKPLLELKWPQQGGQLTGVNALWLFHQVRQIMPGITLDDVIATLMEMKADGWVWIDGTFWRFCSQHNCQVEHQLRYLYAAEGSYDPHVFECTICGDKWTRTNKKHKAGRPLQFNWKRGGDLSWLDSSLQGQRAAQSV
jgi:hypothetical protein